MADGSKIYGQTTLDGHKSYGLVSTDTDGVVTVNDAPSDGTIYGRKDGAWVEASVDLSGYAELAGAEFTGDVETVDLFVKGTFANYNPDTPDMGVELTSDLRGYGEDYVTEKAITFCSVGYNDLTVEGGFRYYDGELQVYRSGSWDTLLAGVQIVTDDTETPLDVELTNFDYTLSIITGNSDELDFNGEPLVQQMHAPMGCYASHQVLDGGTF
jgi:hypothetical protein